MTEAAGGDLVPMYSIGTTSPNAVLLADLHSIEIDLRYASRLFARVAEMDADSDGDARRALYDSAAIAYRRGFTTGSSLIMKGKSRARVPAEIINALSEQDRAVHQALLDRANTHIAHRVSSYEQAKTLVFLDNPQVGRAVAGATVLAVRYVGPKPEDAERDAKIAGHLADNVSLAVQDLTALVIAEAKAADLDHLYTLATPMNVLP